MRAVRSSGESFNPNSCPAASGDSQGIVAPGQHPPPRSNTGRGRSGRDLSPSRGRARRYRPAGPADRPAPATWPRSTSLHSSSAAWASPIRQSPAAAYVTISLAELTATMMSSVVMSAGIPLRRCRGQLTIRNRLQGRDITNLQCRAYCFNTSIIFEYRRDVAI